MKPTELLELLQDMYRDKSALVARHVAVSRHVGNLDFNNTYQYTVSREDTHLAWLRSSIEELGAVAAAPTPEPALQPPAGKDGYLALVREDAAGVQAFLEKYRNRIEGVTNARHRGMFRVILGETEEHRRFFEQASAGREDLLGRRADGGPRRGAVMASRWVGD